MEWARRFRERLRGRVRPREFIDRDGLAILAVLVAFAALAGYAYWKGPPYVPRDFEARVVEKSLTIRETDLGSRPVMRLLVEEEGGRRFNVKVGGEVYERARAGMWVSRRAGELRLSGDEPAPAPPGGRGPAGAEPR